MARNDSLFKLQQYQRTQNLINDLNFTKATILPGPASAENMPQPSPVESSQSFLLRRTLDSVNKHDMTFVREHLKVFSELDPANPYYSSLLERINHGEHLTWKEFEDALTRFSSQEYYMTKLQDEINNEKINASLAGIPEEEIEKTALKPAETLPETSNEPPETPQSESPRNDPSFPHTESNNHPETPHYNTQRPQGLSSRGEENLKQANKTIQKTQAQIKQAEAPQLSKRMSAKLNSTNRVMRTRPTRVTPISSRSRKTRALSKVTPRLGTAAALGGGGAAGSGSLLGNLLGARSALQAGQWLANKLGLRSIGNLLGKLMPEKLIAQGIRGLWNLGGSFGRAAFDGLIRSILPRAGFSALSGAGGTIGSWFTGAGAVIGSIGFGTILVWAVVIFSAIFFIFAVYDSNTECGQPGKVELNKTATDSNGAVKENFEPNQQINYKITLNYNIKCSTAYLDRVEVKDIIPPSLTYQANSAKSSKVAEIPQTPTEIDDPFFEENGADTLPGQIDPEFPAADDIRLDGNILTWRLGKVPANTVITMTFSATPNQTDTWISNQATAGYTIVSRAGLFSGNLTDATGLLPNPLPPPPENWESVKSQIIAAFNKHPELIDIYKQGSAEAGVPWQVLAGLHFVETGSGPGPDSSLVSGRKIGQMEPDINPSKCAAGRSGPGVPVPIDGGCGFTNQLDSAIYASHHLAEKIGKPPSTFAEAVEVVSRYNGGGNANCGEGLDYGPCPPQFYGEDDPYAMADFDEPHSSKKMYLIFCGDRQRCNARIFDRPGAMAVVRALVEEGF